MSLLDRVRRWEPDAWDRLARLYSPRVYRWCRRAGLQDSDAADITQDVFQAVAQAIGDYRRDNAGDRFRAWMWTITRNKLRDYFRHQATRPPTVQRNPAEFPFETEDPDAAVGFDFLGSLAHQAVEEVRGEFEERTWQAFVQVVLDGRQPRDVAADLELSPGAVYTAKWRVLKRLRDELDGLL